MADSARPKGFRLLARALKTRKSASMLAFGFSSGLPFALLIGTLNAWLGDAKVDLATIGVISWIGLASAFKFLWSPLVDRIELPGLNTLGRRKSWIVLCQALIIFSFIGLSLTNPAANIGQFAIFAVIGAMGWSTQDIAIDAWRIDVADDETPVELLSSIYQFGSRAASLVGGAFALMLAARSSWPAVYTLMAALMALMAAVALFAPDTDRPPRALLSDLLRQPGEIEPRVRWAALAVVGAGWVWAIGMIVSFMVRMLEPVPKGAKAPSAGDFLTMWGVWIIAATVFLPLAVAAAMNWFKTRGRHLQSAEDKSVSTARTVANHLYTALVSPLSELAGRLGWGVLILIGLILTYAICYNVWASFAYPFYLGNPHYLGSLDYTKDEVAFASKIFGIVMSILGVSLGAYLFVRIGRFPTVLIGAILPIFGNFLYADLADGAAYIDYVLGLSRIDLLVHAFGGDLRMARLLITICYENISTGLAGAAFVAYLSSIVSKRYSAVQYALLSSLTFLVGSLCKGMVGEMIAKDGYAIVFREVAYGGLLAILFVLLEWWRASRVPPAAEPGHTAESA